jgi:hypothetical protein
MTAKRRKLQRLPHVQITPEVAWAFEQCKKLATQCTCQPAADPKFYWRTTECGACVSWWDCQTVIHHSLRLPPHCWPALPEPGGRESSDAQRKLYEQLDAALTGA